MAGSRGARAAKVERGAKEHGQPAVVWRGATAEAEAGFVSQLGCSVADWLWGVLRDARRWGIILPLRLK